MGRSVPQRELRNNYRSLLREVEAGGEVTITDAGRPVARLVPVTGRKTFFSAADLERVLGRERIDPVAFFRDVRPPDAERVFDDA